MTAFYDWLLMSAGNLDGKPPAGFDLERMLHGLVEGRGEWVYEKTKPFADAGVAKAQLVMGILYQVGIGVEQDGHKALSFYGAAAEQNDALAWKNMGTIYLLGLAGVAIDKSAAHDCFARAKHIEIEQAANELVWDQTIH